MKDVFYSLRDNESGEHIYTLKVSEGTDIRDQLIEKIKGACASHYDLDVIDVKIHSENIGKYGAHSIDVSIKTKNDEYWENDYNLEITRTWII